MRGRTRSVAAIDLLGDAKVPRLGPQIDGGDGRTAILERIPGIGVAIADFVEGIADAVVAADAGFLPGLEPQGVGFLDLSLALEAGWRGQSRHDGHDGESDGEKR